MPLHVRARRINKNRPVNRLLGQTKIREGPRIPFLHPPANYKKVKLTELREVGCSTKKTKGSNGDKDSEKNKLLRPRLVSRSSSAVYQFDTAKVWKRRQNRAIERKRRRNTGGSSLYHDRRHSFSIDITYRNNNGHKSHEFFGSICSHMAAVT